MSKTAQLEEIRKKLNAEAKKKGRERPIAYVVAGNEHLLDLGIIPSGNLAVDRAIGGGLSRGGMSMIAGTQGTGKTSFAMNIIAHNQRVDPEFRACYVYVEGNDFPLEAMRLAGVDESRLERLEVATHGEDIFDSMLAYLVDGKGNPLDLLDFVVIDSVAAVVPKAELDANEKEGQAKMTVGRQGAMFSKLFRDLMGIGSLGRAHLLLINQERADLAAQYAGAKTLPGGKAVMYYPKIILEFSMVKGERVVLNLGKADEKAIGHTVRFRVTKNNTGRGFPYAEGKYQVLFGRGVNEHFSLANAAIESVLERVGASSTYQAEYQGQLRKFNGRPGVETALNDPVFAAWIREQALKGSRPAPAVPSDETVDREVAEE